MGQHIINGHIKIGVYRLHLSVQCTQEFYEIIFSHINGTKIIYRWHSKNVQTINSNWASSGFHLKIGQVLQNNCC